ncbi:MAG: hypothetical protein PHH61_06475 [Candidatus Nanoarchaeia archaeon]|jgi:hypothetical protein|nr:hypothetical protein [Candidatus Nanoarchaeia archaeon]
MLARTFDPFFKSGYPTFPRFVNGHYCYTCKELTEHREENGFRICNVCGASRPYLLSTMSNYDKKKALAERFQSAIFASILETEVEVIEPCLLADCGKWKRKGEGFSANRWIRVKNHLNIDSNLEEKLFDRT